MRPSHSHALSALIKLLIVMILVVLLFNPAVSWQAAIVFLIIIIFLIGFIIITYENFEHGIRKQLAKKEDDALLNIEDKTDNTEKKLTNADLASAEKTEEK
ncbi:hypothetical protein PsalN5692_01781 [Piscirickettsia salmonis]|nr:hypothetical protein PsalN5692_01781 [Piscirickettsia salmonis]